jgi:hypothetical protein
MIKRSGYSYEHEVVSQIDEGALAVRCPACPNEDNTDFDAMDATDKP